MNNPNNFATNLRALKEARQLSWTEFSMELGIPKTTLQSVMENGQTSLDTACRITEALDIPLSELLQEPCEMKHWSIVSSLLTPFEWYNTLTAEKQEIVKDCVVQLLEVLKK